MNTSISITNERLYRRPVVRGRQHSLPATELPDNPFLIRRHAGPALPQPVLPHGKVRGVLKDMVFWFALLTGIVLFIGMVGLIITEANAPVMNGNPETCLYMPELRSASSCANGG